VEAHSADAKIEVDDLEFIVILALIHLPNMIKLAKVRRRVTATVRLAACVGHAALSTLPPPVLQPGPLKTERVPDVLVR